MHATGTWLGGYATRLDDGRGHHVTIDLPEDEDGQNLGTSALELNVLSLAGCITTIFALVAERRHVAFDAMRVDLTAERPKGAKTVTRVVGTFHVVSGAAEADVASALAITLRTCPVSVLYGSAQIPVDVRLVMDPSGPKEAVARASEGPGKGEPGQEHGAHSGAAHPHGMHGRAWGREEAIAALDAPERRLSQDPEKLWPRIGLSEGDHLAEVGAGTGFFALSAARRVGPHGKVFAIDLSEELVALVRERAAEAGLAQLVAVKNTPEGIPLPSASADVILLANVLHDIPDATLAEAVRLLRPGGRLVNLDWKKEATPGGPPVGVRYAPERAAERLAAHGLRLTDSWEFGPYHYAQLLERAGAVRSPGVR